MERRRMRDSVRAHAGVTSETKPRATASTSRSRPSPHHGEPQQTRRAPAKILRGDDIPYTLSVNISEFAVHHTLCVQPAKRAHSEGSPDALAACKAILTLRVELFPKASTQLGCAALI